MKKIIITVISVILLIIISIYMNYKEVVINQNDVAEFNSQYEFYNKESILGTNITTIINKATDNNEQKEIPKDENGLYILDDKYSIEIYVYMKESDTTYRMERFNEVGLSDFTKYFGEVNFECTDIKYHDKTGQIASMTFSSLEF